MPNPLRKTFAQDGSKDRRTSASQPSHGVEMEVKMSAIAATTAYRKENSASIRQGVKDPSLGLEIKTKIK